MERKDLLEANAAIFSVQGKAINDNASRDIKVLVVGNPANTNALIAQRNAPDINPRQFTAMTRLDHNRAPGPARQKTGKTINDVKKMTIWGNHSATQYPDLHHCKVKGKVAWIWWIRTGMRTPSSPPCSSAVPPSSRPVVPPPPPPPPTPPSTICAAGHWAPPKATGSAWASQRRQLRHQEGVIYSFPVICKNGDYEIVQGLEVDEFSRARMQALPSRS
jgi:malate dehydrogenase